MLCHGDAHTANLLVDNDDQVWLLDWDEAVLAPRERDLMFVLDGVLADRLVAPLEQSWFFDGSGAVEVDPALLAYYRCSWAVQDIAGFAGRVLDGDQSWTQERAEALTLFQSLLTPTGIVELALRSLHEVG